MQLTNISIYQSRNLVKEEALSHWWGGGGLLHQKQRKKERKKKIKKHLQIPSLHTAHNIQNVNEREILRIDSSPKWENFVYRGSLRFRPLDSSTSAIYWLSRSSPDLTVLPYTHGQRTCFIGFRHANHNTKSKSFEMTSLILQTTCTNIYDFHCSFRFNGTTHGQALSLTNNA